MKTRSWRRRGAAGGGRGDGIHLPRRIEAAATH